MLAGQSRSARITPERLLTLEFPLPRSSREEVRPIELKVTAGPMTFARTWCAKTEASIVPLAALSESLTTGHCLRKGPEKPLDDQSGVQVARRESTCGGRPMPGIFMHPPYKHGVGYAFALFEPVVLPPSPPAAFRCQVGKADGSDPGDGVLFRVAVVTPDGQQTIVAEKQWIEHAWTPLEADLSRWAGRPVKIKLIADVGPADNSSGDWACWSDVRIESADRQLQTTLHDQPVALQRAQ